MSERKFAITVAILYGALVLLSLGDPLMLLSAGRLLLGERVDLVFSLVPYAIVSYLLVYLTFIGRESRGSSFLFLLIISVVLFFIVRFLSGEREKLHLIEFALLGGLLLRPIKLWGLGRGAAYGLAVAVGLGTAGCDELLQVLFSIKVFSVRDVMVNGMAVILGAVMYGGLFYHPSYGGEAPKTSS
jgi:hypothetical protein